MRKLIKFTIGLPVLILVSLGCVCILLVECVISDDDVFKFNINHIKELWTN